MSSERMKFWCMYCGQKLGIQVEHEGIAIPCPRCSRLLTVPAATDLMPVGAAPPQPEPEPPAQQAEAQDNFQVDFAARPKKPRKIITLPDSDPSTGAKTPTVDPTQGSPAPRIRKPSSGAGSGPKSRRKMKIVRKRR